MIANTGKHHPLFNSNDETYPIKVGNRKLLGIKIDKELNFNEHVQSLSKKAGQKTPHYQDLHLLRILNKGD